MKHPAGWSKWTHREQGGTYTFLTVAKGTGADHGTEFAYYLGMDRGTATVSAFVRRLDDWHREMELVESGQPEVELDELI